MRLKSFYYILVLLSILLFSSISQAKTVDSPTSKTVAKNFFALKGQAILPTQDFDIIIENKFKYNTTYYIYGFSEGGFVIVSGDDSIIPILGYSLDSPIEVDNMPPALGEWLDNSDQQIDDAINNNLDNSKTILLWDEITNFNKASVRKSYKYSNKLDVAPLLSTTWHQLCYYNELCPYDTHGPCNHAIVGCVATAMGQVMKYWNYPPQGIGSFSYVDPTYGTQVANFGATTYDWSSMPNKATSSNIAMATLLYHCGVSVIMYYGTSASGGSTSRVPSSLLNYFNYSPSAKMIFKRNYSHIVWMNILRSELDANRPMQYSGGNHSWVCDGYQGNDYFHFNWGWGGGGDGYYYLNDLTPSSSNYTVDQNAIVGITPSTDNPNILLIPSSLSFSAFQNGYLPNSQQLIVDNAGGSLNWTASESTNWLSITPYSGTNNGTITVNITDTNLNVGDYTADITISGNAVNSPQIITIYYSVTEQFVRTNTNLIVPDNDCMNCINYYTDALDEYNHSYDIWNYSTPPSATVLNQYIVGGNVIWYTARDYQDVINDNERISIQGYLSNGGRLFFSGENLAYHSNLNPTATTWFNTYFYSTYVKVSTNLYGVNGVNFDPISNNLNLNLLNEVLGGWCLSDEIDPILSADPIFYYDQSKTSNIQTNSNSALNPIFSQTDSYNTLADINSSGTAGIKVDNGLYKLVYLSFGFEAIADETGRAILMNRILNWLNPPPSPCSPNGAIIYNTETGKFNFCENGVWIEK